MVAQSPPKPWERGAPATTSTGLPTSSVASTSSQPTAAAASTSTTAPTVPDRPTALSSTVDANASAYTNPANSAYGNRFGTSAYSSPYSGYSSYGSPYSRFGGSMYGNSMYGGMGGMYGGMGGMGGMYGGMGGMGGMFGGMPGMNPADPNNPQNSMTQNFAQSTQATFQIIESIVGAFGGFAQMLESTYMATHSSFFAMISVAEQFGNLRQTLGSVLGIYAIMRWVRTLASKLTGRPPPADATALTPANFFASQFGGGNGKMVIGPDGTPVPKPSKKPFIVFLLAVFGLPYLMGKFIRALARSQEENQAQMMSANGQLGPQAQGPLDAQGKIDPTKLDFCRALYDYPPSDAIAQGSFMQEFDLQVKKGDLVAVLDKRPSGANSAQDEDWWKCRARDGRMGFLPAVYLETIQRKPQAQITEKGDERANSLPASVSSAVNMKGDSAIQSRANTLATAGRAQTMSSASGSAHSRSASLNATGKVDQKGAGKVGVEQFQKSWGTGS